MSFFEAHNSKTGKSRWQREWRQHPGGVSSSLRLSLLRYNGKDTHKSTETFKQHNRCLRDPCSHISERGGAELPGRQWKEVRGISSTSPTGRHLGRRTACSSERRRGRGQSFVGMPSLSELPPSLWDSSTLRRLGNHWAVFTKPNIPGGQRARTELEHLRARAQEWKRPSPTWHASTVGQPEQETPAKVPAHICVNQRRPAVKCR